LNLNLKLTIKIGASLKKGSIKLQNMENTICYERKINGNVMEKSRRFPNALLI